MFNWTENVTLPKITDIIDYETIPPPIWRLFTYPWFYYFGGWFIAMIIGVLAAALYIKTDNALVPITFSMVMVILYGAILNAVPDNGLPSAEGFVFLVGVLGAFGIGFLLYKLFIEE